MAYLQLQNVTKNFGSFRALKGINLDIQEGEFVSFLGGSGCGKTTTLRIIGGFERASSGRVLLGGEDLSSVPPEKRELGFVFQHYALFPNMTARKNIAFGLKNLGLSKAAEEGRVDELLTQVRMEGFGHRYPRELSGGQQQRVALARALARKPRVLLLDEPLSALDAKIRVHLRGELRAIQRDLGVTTVYVTHDQEEALSLSDRVVLMKDGAIEQVGSPEELYRRPQTAYAASFVGTANRLPATIEDPVEGSLRLGPLTLSLGPMAPLEAAKGGEKVQVMLRPESLRLEAAEGKEDRGGDLVLQGILRERHFQGSTVRSSVELSMPGLQGTTILVDAFDGPEVESIREGSPVRVTADTGRCVAFFGD